jgi:fibronectin type 3 domain-containing protein
MSGATFPVTLNPTLALTLDVSFDPQTAGAVSSQLTVNSNASTNSTAIVGISGTGVSASGSGSRSHQVTLSWDAPSSSSDPVVGYDIYRATSGGSTYELLNSSTDAQTTYVDTNVQANASYVYYVTSVDSSGVQSSSSNVVTASIP